MPELARELEIPREMNELDGVIASLDEGLSELRRRLQPVLSNTEKEENICEEPSLKGASSDLAIQLMRRKEKIQNLFRIVLNLNEGLEI